MEFTVEKKVTVTLTEDQIVTLSLGLAFKGDNDVSEYGFEMCTTTAMKQLFDDMLEAVRK